MNVVDEAVLLSPYHGARDFLLAGSSELRGLHYLQLPEDGEVYSARLDIERALPRLVMRRNLPGQEPAGAIFGPSAYTEDAELDRHFVVYSEGEGFAHHLLVRDEVKASLAEVRSQLRRVEVAPHEDGARLMVDVRTAGDGALVERAISLSMALLEAADDVAARDHRYQNAWELHEREGPDELAADVLGALRDRIVSATLWVAGHVERSGNSLEARCSLADAGVEQHGTLHVRWRDEAAHAVDVELVGGLNEHVGEHAELKREPGGLRGFLARIGELEVGDEPLDHAYIIDAEPKAKPLLLRARAPLIALGRFDTRITFEVTRLLSITRDVNADDDTLEAVVEQTLRLWRAAALYRAGYDLDQVDPFAAPER